MTRPLVWMRAVRDARPKATVDRLAVLWALALRMRADGAGYASVRTLADDVAVCERTARRATDWARECDYLNRTRRGHRLGDGRVVASEWQLTVPVEAESQPDPRDGLSESQPDNAESQPDPNGISTGPESTTKRSSPRGNHQEDNARASANGSTPWERDGVLSVVIDSLEELSGKRVDGEFARREAKRLLDGRTVNDPCAYVRGALRQAAKEGRLDDHLPTPTPPRYGEAEHRRSCDKYGLHWPESNGVACTCNPRLAPTSGGWWNN